LPIAAIELEKMPWTGITGIGPAQPAMGEDGPRSEMSQWAKIRSLQYLGLIPRGYQRPLSPTFASSANAYVIRLFGSPLPLQSLHFSSLATR